MSANSISGGIKIIVLVAKEEYDSSVIFLYNYTRPPTCKFKLVEFAAGSPVRPPVSKVNV